MISFSSDDALRDTSVSRLVGDLLNDHMRRERNYGEARERYLADPPRRLKREGGYPSREEVQAGQDLGGFEVVDPLAREPAELL